MWDKLIWSTLHHSTHHIFSLLLTLMLKWNKSRLVAGCEQAVPGPDSDSWVTGEAAECHASQ